jgi:hypothetical protein
MSKRECMVYMMIWYVYRLSASRELAAADDKAWIYRYILSP